MNRNVRLNFCYNFSSLFCISGDYVEDVGEVLDDSSRLDTTVDSRTGVQANEANQAEEQLDKFPLTCHCPHQYRKWRFNFFISLYVQDGDKSSGVPVRDKE